MKDSTWVYKHLLPPDVVQKIEKERSEDPPIHYENGVPYIRICEIQEEDRELFRAWLRGHGAPFIEGAGDCAWPNDFFIWQSKNSRKDGTSR